MRWDHPTRLRHRYAWSGGPRWLVVAAVLGMLGAGLGTVAGGTSGAQLKAPRRVVVYFDPMYVDTSPVGSGEAENVRSTLVARGFTVDTFTGTTGAAWSPALAGADVLVVPELEVNPGLADDLDAPAALDGFVRGGRRLVTFNDQNFQFMEALLNENPGSFTSGKSCPCARAGSAAGTEFEGGPSLLQVVSSTATLDVTSPTVPTAGVYTEVGATAQAGVATVKDAGDMVYFGWDWTFETGQEALFPDWFEVLSRAVEGTVAQPEAPQPQAPPAQASPPTPPPAPVSAGPRFTG